MLGNGGIPISRGKPDFMTTSFATVDLLKTYRITLSTTLKNGKKIHFKAKDIRELSKIIDFV